MIRFRIFCALLLLLSSVGCATLPTFRGPPLQLAKTVPTWPGELHDYRGIIHCHSYLSHDSRGTVEEIQRACDRVGVDFVIMTDHITPASIAKGLRGQRGRTLFIVGAELSRGGGSILGLDLAEYVNAKLSTENIVGVIHGLHGLAFIGHAEIFRDWKVAEFDGIEVYNTHANVKMANKAWLVTKALFVPPGTLFRSLIALHPPNFQRWDTIAGQRRFVGIFGNDAHQNIHIFGPNGGTVGTYEQLFKITTTHVIAAKLDRESVMAALKEGHCYGALELWGDATGFAFTGTDGTKSVMMGDETQFGSNWVLNVQLPVAAEIRIIHNGLTIHQAKQQAMVYPALLPGVYRVEAWLGNRPWIFSNPIYLRNDPKP